MRSRQKQRELKKEEKLEAKNVYGHRDLTPFNAVTRLRGETKLLLK
ncbi:hypothetical protein DEAC_c23300 [Desulfosporosinus acididurans]|jgi:hypothetical protein|uniref:Uncharacterized protein n=1 Tax=Desulfosporosinus acididurans TaxID=476652 RepID=A0A0J1FQC5_9FIRM|nr:hypothetical protein [Desulfosporosinus acididurans]KLU65700.1 hypothetical protein DEAC_c23300 [Desulfosporosinus acididurans]